MQTISAQIRKWALLSALIILQSTTSTRAAVDVGQVQTSTIGHSFFSLAGNHTVSDHLVDQDQSSGGGGVLQSFSANFDTNNQFVLTIAAPPGQKFLVQPPAGQEVRFFAVMDWQGPYALSNGPSYFGTVAVSFGDLEGTAPDFSASRTVLSELHGFVGFNDIRSTAFSNVVAFTSITLTATVPSTNVGSGTWEYRPTSDSAFALLTRTSQTNDPGRFVSIVPENPAPTLQPHVLFQFSGAANPLARMVRAPDGSLYGTTAGGSDGGTVFQVTTNDTVITLVNFTASTGYHPETAGLTLGGDGALYGTTVYGGSKGYGVVFRMTANGTLTTLVNFNNANGAFPSGGLTLGGDGNFYGTTVTGTNYYGTVFKVTTNGALTTLANFPSDYGSFPSGLTLGRDGSFYGTTYNGYDAKGTVFRVTTTGALTRLAALEGVSPYSTGLTLGNDGNFYGTTFEGGHHGLGTVFRVTPDGAVTTLVNFSGRNGANPAGGLTLGSDGYFYGTTVYGGAFEGTVFKMTPDGILTTLANFTDRLHGVGPYGGVTVGSNGSLYGTTVTGGSGDSGTVFRLDLPPTIISQPASRTNVAGTTALFTVTASGTKPFSYQWLKDGTNVVEGGDVSGASSSTLRLANLQLDDAGNFAVVVTNNSGSVTSSVAVLTMQARSNGTAVLTFDDLSPGADYALIQNDYGNLQWNNLGVLNGSSRPATEGYRTGMVSPNNVAFNLFGDPAAISSATTFDLNSAYLTAAFVNGLQIEVQGYVGTSLTYDKTYSVNTTGPTLIHFDYLGVDQVKFIPSPGSPFVMDNLAVTVPVVNQSTPMRLGVNLILQSNGNVTVTFTGTLQSAGAVHGTFEDLPGNPQGTYTIPKGSLTTQRYFRAKGN